MHVKANILTDLYELIDEAVRLTTSPWSMSTKLTYHYDNQSTWTSVPVSLNRGQNIDVIHKGVSLGLFLAVETSTVQSFGTVLSQPHGS